MFTLVQLKATIDLQAEPPGSHAYKRGIRGYTARIFPCRTCGRDTNVIWSSNEDPCRVVIACRIEHA